MSCGLGAPALGVDGAIGWGQGGGQGAGLPSAVAYIGHGCGQARPVAPAESEFPHGDGHGR